MGNREIKTSNQTKEEIVEGLSLRVTTCTPSLTYIRARLGGGGGGGGGVRLLILFCSLQRGSNGFITHFPGGVQLFPGGGGGGPNANFYRHPYNYITITCDLPGGYGPPIPPLDPDMDNVTFWHESAQTSLCGLLLSLETPNANRSIVFKRLA